MKLPRFSLRLLLLFMALCAVATAWLRARYDLAQTQLRGQLQRLEIDREQQLLRLDSPIYSDPDSRRFIRSELKRTDALIDQIQQKLPKK
jgi:hypothetical protein